MCIDARQCAPAAEACDVLQNSGLSVAVRPTFLLAGGAKTGAAINVKKGQFFWAPLGHGQCGRENRILPGTNGSCCVDRGTSFGYNTLGVLIFVACQLWHRRGSPVVFDAHAFGATARRAGPPHRAGSAKFAPVSGARGPVPCGRVGAVHRNRMKDPLTAPPLTARTWIPIDSDGSP